MNVLLVDVLSLIRFSDGFLRKEPVDVLSIQHEEATTQPCTLVAKTVMYFLLIT
eukprot:m.91638 g.91638  ORF g.91638 m.91638 type:complete len:54 (+) comp14640_c0_seq2:362-523(+)